MLANCIKLNPFYYDEYISNMDYKSSQLKEEYEKQIRSVLLKFLYLANNGSLIV